jgi:pSer/pThr/pTyr-binding forkhead associated (FHA) protein
MGFSLIIQEGKDQGREYSFDQPEVTIGRTAENDVVLYEPGIARHHVTIREEEGRYYVQDMGSAKGTELNGNPVTENELENGDLISVGQVVLCFQVKGQEPEEATRITTRDKAVQRPKRALPRSPSRKPRPVVKKTSTEESNTEEEDSNTQESNDEDSNAEGSNGDDANAEESSTDESSTSAEESKLERPDSEDISKTIPPVAPSKPKRSALARPQPVRLARPKAQQPSLLASERARLLRQNAGVLGRVRLFYIQAPRPVQLGIIGAGILAVLVVLGLAIRALVTVRAPEVVEADHSHDTFKISEQSSKNVYGLGEELGVNVQAQDEVHFQFEYAEPVPVVYYIRFEPLGIDAKDEVDISLNGVHVGFANVSVGETPKIQRLRLPKKYLKTGIPNEIVFDNTLNPPKKISWAIAKPKLVIKPLPRCEREECLREAKKLYEAAEQKISQKQLAARNLFESWLMLHKALLFLETVDPKPELYGLAQSTLREVDKELDSICNKCMLAARRAEELSGAKKALNELKDCLQWFPVGEDEHACRAKLLEKIEE